VGGGRGEGRWKGVGGEVGAGGRGGMKGGGAEGDRGWDDFSALTDDELMCGQHTNLAFLGGGQLGGVCIGLESDRSGSRSH
jgi:hypothetical protein